MLLVRCTKVFCKASVTADIGAYTQALGKRARWHVCVFSLPVLSLAPFAGWLIYIACFPNIHKAKLNKGSLCCDVPVLAPKLKLVPLIL